MKWERTTRGDEGMTMIELLITSTVLVILLGMVLISVNLIDDVSTNVSSQYQEFDQALPALVPFHSMLAAQIEPGPPTVAGVADPARSSPTADVPTPPFGLPANPPPGLPSSAIGNFNMVFFTNIGTGYSNTTSCPTGQSTCTGSSAGPAMIVAQELDPSGAPVTSATVCSTTTPCSLQVRMYLPQTGLTLGPGAPSCPIQWGAILQTTPCSYSSSYRLLANVLDVVNNPSQLAADGVTPTEPIFSYSFFDPNMPANASGQQAIALSATEVQNNLITGLSTLGYPTDTQNVNACAAPTTPSPYPTAAIACPADAIQSVGIDLMVAKPGTSTQTTVEDRLVVYRYAQSPGSSTAPYQYSEIQG